MIFFHQWLNKYTIHWQLMTIHELWNLIIFLNFKTSLVIAPPPLPRPQPQRYYDALRTKIDMWLSTKRKVIEDYWRNCKISRDDLAIQIEQKYHPNIGQLLICYAFDFKKWICDVFDYKIIKKSLTKFCRLLKDKCCLWETSQNSKIFFQGKLTFFYSNSTR